MYTGSKILLIEDVKDDLVNSFLSACKKANCIDTQVYQLISDLSIEYEPNQYSDFCGEINKILPNIEIAYSFKNAVELIRQAANGEEYEWFFIDRNLSNYGDLETTFNVGKKEFNKDFFNGFGGFLGDYLIVMLLNANVPIEKICFFTNNTAETSLESLTKSPYLHDNNIPDVIRKSVDSQDLIDRLKNSHRSKIRFLYRDIFGNEKVKEIFDPYIEDFISILAKRYKSGADAEYTKGDGIVLRNMIENVVSYITNNPTQSVRNYLNLEDAYSALFKRKYTAQNVEGIKKKYSDITEKNAREFLNEKLKGDKLDQEVRHVIEYATASALFQLAEFYKGNTPKGTPPKHIFSYIDNIYTVTSEFSAHGKNDKTTDDLSADGWSALLSGMLQIMQWVAKKHPNSSSVTK